MSTNKIPTRQLGRNGPVVSAIGFGAMGVGAYYGKTDEKEAMNTLTFAADRGVTFWDTSDAYEGSEAFLGNWLTQTGRRTEIFLATKIGSLDLRKGAQNKYKPCSQPSFLKDQIANSLKNLQTDYLDMLYQHRVDPSVPIEIVMETFLPYLEAGTIKYIGLSECTTEVIKRAKSVPGIGDKLIATQEEYSPFEISNETSELMSDVRSIGMGLVAYSPLGRGMVTGQYKSPDDFEEGDLRRLFPRFSKENFPKSIALVDKFKVIAEKYGVTTGAIALAWMLAKHPDLVPIPGTRNVARLEENAKGAEVVLAEEDVDTITKFVVEADFRNIHRNPAGFEALETRHCIPMSEWKGEEALAA